MCAEAIEPGTSVVEMRRSTSDRRVNERRDPSQFDVDRRQSERRDNVVDAKKQSLENRKRIESESIQLEYCTHAEHTHNERRLVDDRSGRRLKERRINERRYVDTSDTYFERRRG